MTQAWTKILMMLAGLMLQAAAAHSADYPLKMVSRQPQTAEVSERSGRGVGLAAMRELCLQHQGKIELLPNESGQGTLLHVQIRCSSVQMENTKTVAG